MDGPLPVVELHLLRRPVLDRFAVEMAFSWLSGASRATTDLPGTSNSYSYIELILVVL